MFWNKVVADGSTCKYNEIFVEKYLSQVQGVDYHETFVPVAKMDSIRLVLTISTSKHWEVHNMDVKLEFMHEDIHEEIYMNNTKGYISDTYLVCKQRSHYTG